MYTLRRISGAGVQMHFALGRTYTFVSEVDAPEEFKRDLIRFYYGPAENFDEAKAYEIEKRTGLHKDVYAFVGDEEGKNVYPLVVGQAAFIMNENGKTFANVSCFHRENKQKEESGQVEKTLPEIIEWLKGYKLPDIFQALKAITRTARHDAFLDDCIHHFTPINPEHDVPKDEVTLR